MFAKRPHRDENEEDLLKLQEEFFKNKTKSSVSVLKTTKDAVSQQEVPDISEAVQEQLSNTFEAVPSSMSIGQIVVREQKSEAKKSNVHMCLSSGGFPQAKRRDLKVIGNKSGSIFAQQMKKVKQIETCGSSSKMHMDVEAKCINTVMDKVPLQSCLVLGKEGEDIHKENVNTLSRMSEEEILEEKKKLIETMDPAIIAYLKAKRKETLKLEEKNVEPSIADKNKCIETMDVNEIETPNEILAKNITEKWLNFDEVETNKLLWMKDVKVPKITKDQAYEARFDFSGCLQPFTEKEISEKSRTLYHHGEEPGRPGYTLQELFQLARSSVIQQKVTALHTIANLLSLQSSGVYDAVIDLPTEQIFFVLRFCIDDNTASVLNASIKALRSLFYYPIDETCLDNMLGFGVGFVQPTLGFEDEDTEDDRTINDQQMAEMNLIKCLARSDILIRIRYIVSVVQPPVETVAYCLELLMRLARDSQRIMTQVFKCDGLLTAVVKHCLPQLHNIDVSKQTFKAPMPQALKLLRVLASRSRFISAELIIRHKIMDRICVYLANDITTSTVGLKIQTECFRLWNVLLHYSLAVDVFNQLQPILLRILDYHVRSTNINDSTYLMQTHAASLVSTITMCAKKDTQMVYPFVPFLTQGFLKWTAQLANVTDCVCSQLQITSSVINCFAVLSQIDHGSFNSDELETSLSNLLQSKGFAVITQDLNSSSNLLNDYEVHKTGAAFISAGAAVWFAPDHVVPTLNTNSAFPLLNVMTNFVINGSDTLKLQFLAHASICDYLKALLHSKQHHLTSNWFTKIESQLIMNALLIAASIRQLVDNTFYYEIAVRCLSVFDAEQKAQIVFVLQNIVLSTSFYGHEVLMQRLNLAEPDELLHSALQNLDEIVKIYIRVLGLDQDINDYSTNAANDVKSGNVLPIDWIYSPIIALYSAQSSELKGNETHQRSYIKGCLQWLYVYEMYFPTLAARIDTTDRFCRLSCVFLGSDGLFLEPEIHVLLQSCFKCLIRSGISEIDFDKTIQGLNNFQDLYIQLLEQYQGVSYGDVLFGNFILLPLLQRHNAKWRKVLWSEYAGVVQILNITPEQCILPLEEFLYPEETELSLLKCYRRLLMCGHLKMNSLLYTVAKHHVDCYIRKQENK